MHGDSCGRKGIGETPQNGVRGGSPAARGKRSVFPKRCYCTQNFHYVAVYGLCFKNDNLQENRQI
nr:hypothetical protein [Lentibacillus jeotgali]